MKAVFRLFFDASVFMAAAVKGKVDVLLTLDRKHFLTPTVLQAGLSFRIMAPGNFLRDLVKE